MSRRSFRREYLQTLCTFISLISSYKPIPSRLPKVNVAVLQALIRMVGRIIQAEGNKMTYANLGLAFGPTLFPSMSIQCYSPLLEFLDLQYANIWPDAAPRSPALTVRMF